MADTSKAQKLASARKKFKELKKEKQKNSTAPKTSDADSKQSSREQTPVDNELTAQNNQQQTHLPNYFTVDQQQSTEQQVTPAAFFDTFHQQNETKGQLFDATPAPPPPISLDNYFSDETNHLNCSYQNSPLINISNDNNEIHQASPQNEPSEPQYVISSVENFGGNPFSEARPVSAEDGSPKQPQYTISSVESLRQLSQQMAELTQPNADFMTPLTEIELEVRNQELALLLNKERLKREQLEAVVQEYQSRISQIDSSSKEKEVEYSSKYEQDIIRLKEELQYHTQTVGILVAEKAELSATLGQLQLTTNQKTTECEELQARLKASRSRVVDLEREVGILKNEKSQFDNVGKERFGELEKLSRNYQALKDEKDELVQDLLEAREKLKVSSENNLMLQQQVSELSSQLALSNIKIQQLTTGGQNESSGQIEQLTQEKFALEKQVADLNLKIKTLTKEREESNLNYQQYAQQLNMQLGNLSEKLEHILKENESLSIQEQNRVKHIGELEKQLQNLQSDQVTFATQKSHNGEVKAQLEASLGLIENLQVTNVHLQEQNVKILNEKELLMKDFEAKIDTINHLENLVEQLRGNQPDNEKLLATMESDKVAAARAVSQNTEMKAQMESMQEVFMKLNNDKVELTETLTQEQRNNKDLIEKLQKTELHLQTLADAIEIKDKELSHLRESSLELNKQILQSEQLTDRLRHYEAQDHSSHSVQSELQEAQQVISRLNDEIARLKERPSDIEELNKKLEQLELVNKNLETQLRTTTKIEENHTSQLNGTDNCSDTNQNVLDKESAMKHLEQKFLRTMEDIAVLTEEKQRLEHLVLQLQSETETIGEYVALYQHQRSILKQKAIEKDQQLSQLANDRELIKSKLEKLNDLIRKLVLEKGTVTTELLQHHENLTRESSELCEEHAKIHDEISKITENSLKPKDGSSENCDNQNSETAEQIIALLSEIKTSNLVQPAEKLHHCPWCSGQLITV